VMWRMSREEAPRSLREVLALLAPSIISIATLILAALIMGIAALYLWYRASDTFRRYDEAKFGLGRIGASLSLTGLSILVISLVATLFWVLSSLLTSGRLIEGVALGSVTTLLAIAGVVLGVPIYVIGWILYGVMVMRLSEIPSVSQDFKYAGILMIASIVLSMLGSFVVVGALVEIASLIMIIVYSDAAIKLLSSPQ
ncbi:MAG: hypothetical protein QXR35_05905, partial [Candidatus Korarchaeum sp.]